MAEKLVPSREQIRQGLDHVYYEIEQLNNHIELQKLSFRTPENDPAVAKTLDNAKLEAMLFHLRNLVDFFECRSAKRYGDDILGEDYGSLARATGVGKADKVRINKELAHLTYSRPALDAPHRGWKPWELIPPILVRCKEFCDHVVRNFPEGKAKITKEDWARLNEILSRSTAYYLKDKFRSRERVDRRTKGP